MSVRSTSKTELGPAVIEFNRMRFLITDRPSKSNLMIFVDELKRSNVHDLIRVCEPTYNAQVLEKEGIHVKDWQFDDGAPPPKEIVDVWLQLLKETFTENPGSTVAIHCVAGLGRRNGFEYQECQTVTMSNLPEGGVMLWGFMSWKYLDLLAQGHHRAPVLVALALMESGMKYTDAVEYIRQRRRGAINSRQLEFLEKYRPAKALKFNGEARKKCLVM